MKIITDTREQLPLFDEEFRALNVGDYTTLKLLDKFHIERKSLLDLYQTLTSGNNRFKYELFRAAYRRTKLVVYVEGSFEDFINKRFPKGSERKFSKDGLETLVKTFQKKYFLEFNWCKNRAACRQAVYKRLVQESSK